MLRMLFGPDNAKLIPLSFCLGTSYLALVDMISRNRLTYEIPIGIFTTFFRGSLFSVSDSKNERRWLELIKIENLTLGYARHTILEKINLTNDLF